MAVYERTYRPYRGPLTPSRWRLLVLPRYAIREVLRTRLLFAYLMACMIVPLFGAISIYVPYNVKFVQTFFESTGLSTFAGAEQFYTWFMRPQFFFAFFLIFLIGPVLIAADMRNNALPLYFSRPFSRWEYLAGKAAVLLLLVSGITWVPGLLLFLLKSYLAGGAWFVENLRIGIAIFVAWAICIVLMTLIALAISAYVKWTPIAQLGLFFLYIVLAGFGGLITVLLETKWGLLFNLPWMFNVVGLSLFGLPTDDIPPVAAWTVLLVACGLCLLLLQRKIRAYEVERS